MRSPLYYKKHECGQIMTSHRRRDTYWRNPSGKWANSESTFYIEHYCPACDIWINESTDSEWRPEGDELNLGTCCGGCK